MGGLPVKPKLQGYVQQELFDEFERYRTNHNLNQSKALEKLLAEFFNGSSASTAPQDEVAATASLLAAMRSELADLRQELIQRLEIVEDRLADSSAIPLDGLADESAAPMISLSDESVTGFSRLVAESANDSVDIQSGSDYGSAIPLDESADESAGESAGESVVAASEPPEEEPATSEPEEEEVEEVAIAVEETQHLTRNQLGQLLGGNSRETIRQWEKTGKLAEKGWEPVPGTGSSPKNPRLYRSLNRNQ